MPPEKAIEILTLMYLEESTWPPNEHRTALKLAVDHLKASLKDTVARRP